MTVIEIAVFAAVLSGASPIVCHLDEQAVRCSNGFFGRALSPTAVRFENGVVVRREDEQFPVFSTGMKSWIGKTGWLRFANGIGIRRLPEGAYQFSNGLVCISELPTLVRCERRAPPIAP